MFHAHFLTRLSKFAPTPAPAQAPSSNAAAPFPEYSTLPELCTELRPKPATSDKVRALEGMPAEPRICSAAALSQQKMACPASIRPSWMSWSAFGRTNDKLGNITVPVPFWLRTSQEFAIKVTEESPSTQTIINLSQSFRVHYERDIRRVHTTRISHRGRPNISFLSVTSASAGGCNFSFGYPQYLLTIQNQSWWYRRRRHSRQTPGRVRHAQSSSP
ncbi:hypothetical protein K503DRAFT_785283 [Rhizopogon vinicolor AM-OR11-026]|uniref:Uncharacterized protein n=1 Tax=Rhizopogon vinicolor AM-OR11-026 TaxID=1314800 RepID=A0A1B7MRC6_9AGAM|nr:hypothetical protein K503DRAFT_785283 [Rhizopogon vinicolor AM-OR11-026]